MALPSLSTDPPEGEQHRGDQEEQNRSVKIVRHRQPSFAPHRGSRSPFPVVLFLAKGEKARSRHAAGLLRPGESQAIPASQYPHMLWALGPVKGKGLYRTLARVSSFLTSSS